jgi:hypothetical protein
VLLWTQISPRQYGQKASALRIALPALRVVLPPVALARLTTVDVSVDVSVGVSVEIIIVVDVDVAAVPIIFKVGVCCARNPQSLLSRPTVS